MRTSCLILCFFLAFCACRNDHRTRRDVRVRTSEAVDNDEPLPRNAYMRLSGTIAGKDVVVHLLSYDGHLQGAYYYSNIGQDIELRSWDDTDLEDDDYKLSEYVPGEEGNGAAWNITIKGGQVNGTWTSSEGLRQFPISLKEDYPAGATMLDAFWLADSAALIPGNAKSPVAKSTYGYLLPAAAAGNEYAASMLAEMAAGSSVKPNDVNSALKADMQRYFSEYREDLAPLVNEGSLEDEAFSFSYSNDETISVRYNDDNWLVAEHFMSSYTGGAHGNYGSSFLNIDESTRRCWELEDIVADTAALKPLINDAAISYFKIKPGDPVGERLLVDEVPVTDNVYIGPRGLSFVYGPYEIASYADGSITLYLSYKKLQQWLTPAFKERMRLQESAGTARINMYKHLPVYANRRNTALSHRALHTARSL